jgi:hypothetical protein
MVLEMPVGCCRAALALVRVPVSAAEPRLARALVCVHLHTRASRRRLAVDRAVRAWRARTLVHIHVVAVGREAVADVYAARSRVLCDVAVRAHAVGGARATPAPVRIRCHRRVHCRVRALGAVLVRLAGALACVDVAHAASGHLALRCVLRDRASSAHARGIPGRALAMEGIHRDRAGLVSRIQALGLRSCTGCWHTRSRRCCTCHPAARCTHCRTARRRRTCTRRWRSLLHLFLALLFSVVNNSVLQPTCSTRSSRQVIQLTAQRSNRSGTAC